MVGSDANDPRAKLSPGMYNAGETSMGLEHLLLLKKPDAFQLGATDPNDPKVETIVGRLGMGNNKKIPKSAHLLIAQLAFANSDLAFEGNSPVPGKFLWRKYLRHLAAREHATTHVDGLSGWAGRCVGL